MLFGCLRGAAMTSKFQRYKLPLVGSYTISKRGNKVLGNRSKAHNTTLLPPSLTSSHPMGLYVHYPSLTTPPPLQPNQLTTRPLRDPLRHIPSPWTSPPSDLSPYYSTQVTRSQPFDHGAPCGFPRLQQRPALADRLGNPNTNLTQSYKVLLGFYHVPVQASKPALFATAPKRTEAPYPAATCNRALTPLNLTTSPSSQHDKPSKTNLNSV
ncbi:hypothetical protein F511_44698 [Dorcoceras hygrometricum]|uniref:Uncharacterized protein n=1 Tax=Dorcoceras hygrometricum TaxID=472368 RepID=A0A2Z6ZXP2_9LAMI|nr:hypothetical protein F511_44698 [Dorcoceras hygrometricum]